MEDAFNCPLVELGLISDSSDGLTYQFHRGEKPSLPTPVFAAVLSRLWESRFGDRNSLALAEIAYSPESPDKSSSWTKIPSSVILRNSNLSPTAPCATTKRQD